MRRLALEFLGQGPPHGGQLLSATADLAHIAFVIADHDAADDAHLMAVRVVILERDCADDAWLARIGDVDDRRPEMLRIRNVPDERMGAAHRNLAAAGEIEMT